MGGSFLTRMCSKHTLPAVIQKKNQSIGFGKTGILDSAYPKKVSLQRGTAWRFGAKKGRCERCKNACISQDRASGTHSKCPVMPT